MQSHGRNSMHLGMQMWSNQPAEVETKMGNKDENGQRIQNEELG